MVHDIIAWTLVLTLGLPTVLHMHATALSPLIRPLWTRFQIWYLTRQIAKLEAIGR